ncbi:MAG: GIY-YIG nuclease family protein [Nitrospira sp.]|nr:GIY-YIG nuclease family protein [Nitrospira sp.]MDE0485678.1 GIY-YIG nuclease family protein [Nitrospira sp.]
MEHEPREVTELYEGVRRVLDSADDQGRKIGDCKYGVYLFLDYDGEPIYVGQTRESLRNRIRRHLTNQRTDAVAMSVLDPFEVAEIEMWPFWNVSPKKAHQILRRAEYTVYCHALKGSTFQAILNEGEIVEAEFIALPSSVRVRILADESYKMREHPDIRLARRARTIANLARIISERKVKIGIRRTLLAQARRLEALARKRLDDLIAEQALDPDQ